MALLATVGVTVVPVVGFVHQRGVARDILREEREAIATGELAVLASLAWTVNEVQIENLLTAMTSRRTVTAVRFTPEVGIPLEVVSDRFDPVRDSVHEWPVVFVHDGEPVPVGWFHVWMPPGRVIAADVGGLITTIASGVVGVIAVIAAFTVVAHRMISVPLLALQQDLAALETASSLPRWWTEHLTGDRTRETRRAREAIDRAIRQTQDEIFARGHAEQILAGSLREKEVLLQEVHHRVKNNLQLVMSLLSLQRDSVDDPGARTALLDSEHRVLSMSIVHELLYRGESDYSINLQEYLENLVRGLHTGSTATATVRAEADPVFVTIDVAIPTGLVVAELVTNAVKHAFRTPAGGEVIVRARRAETDSCVCVSVADNGSGLSENGLDNQSSGLGMRIVRALTEQLGSELSVDSDDNGARFSFCVPTVTSDGGPAA